MSDRSQILNDPEEAFRIGFEGGQSSLWTAMPGLVAAVDLTTMTISVQPSIQGTITDENGQKQSVNLPLLINVPIVFPNAGNFILTLPIAIGDEVLVIFGSRCIDSWWQSGGIGRPIEGRMHDLSDGFAIPGPSSLPKIYPNISSTAAQLRNKLGTSYIEMSADGKIKVVSPVEIDLIGPVKVTGTMDVTGAVTVTGTFGVTGNVAITGNTTNSGTLNSTGEITRGGIPLSTHKHTGVTTGAGTSGGPTA